MNFNPDGSSIRVCNSLGDRPSTLLAHPKNRRLAHCAATFELLVFVLVGLDTADETLINFDDADLETIRAALTRDHDDELKRAGLVRG
jgi:hypothetical protein